MSELYSWIEYLNMEAAGSRETLAPLYESTGYHNIVERDFNIHLCENLKIS
jgi:hypothetical protein